MDFGLVASSCSSSSSGFASVVSDPLTEQKRYGSGLFRKQEDTDNNHLDDDNDEDGCLKGSDKMANSFGSDLSSGSDNGKSMSLLRSNCSPLFSPNPHQQDNLMLSFSSSTSNSQNAALFPYFQLSPVSPYSSRNTGSNSSSSGTYNGFTASQGIELEHQTLIYKYISANIPIPSNLLLPIRKAFESAGLSCLRSNTLGWGGFNMGFSSNADPEPGRCRRTDGKKWRCSKDAVPDQKYCERHMNRGRHRSRKPVEATVHAAHSSAGSTPAKAPPPSTPKPSPSTDSINGVFIGKNVTCGEKQLETSSMFSSRNFNTEPKDDFFITKHQSPLEKTSYNGFGMVSNASLLNPSPSRSLHVSPNQSADVSHNQLLHFIDNWPQIPSSSTHLPQPSDFLSSMATTALSPLKLSCESLGGGMEEGGNSRNIPLSWESSMGGPLGEALHNSSSQSSPTGVLQKPFVSISNSSAGSSPRHEGSSFCSDMLRPVPSLVHCSWSVDP